MSRRRGIALSAIVLILRLGFVAGESRCVPGHDAPSQHHKQQSHGPTAPTLPVCCQALTSCALTADVTRAGTAPVGGSTTSRGSGSAFRYALSRSTAPDAPPPRA